MQKKKQSGNGLLTAVLPVARAVLPFLGKSAASGAIGHWSLVIGLGSSLLVKIFGGKRRKRKRLKKIIVYKRYVR